MNTTARVPHPKLVSLHITRRQVLLLTALGGITLLGGFLRFYQLGANGYGNAYYAATVKSMLTSWPNFFFGAFEPGGSVTVDKPPLGFWVEALSAILFGLNGFALALPNALGGTLSIPLLVWLVKQPFGSFAGLAAGLVLALTPVSVATDRNNTIDGLLIFMLLVSAWLVWRSLERARLRELLLAALLIGLAFNVKMLQAYMVLPGLYGLYLLCAQTHWWKRLLQLGIATIVLLAVSLSWALVVDAVPPQNRPYIGSSTNNTVMELILGHNGISRIVGGLGPQGFLGLFKPGPVNPTQGQPPLTQGQGPNRQPPVSPGQGPAVQPSQDGPASPAQPANPPGAAGPSAEVGEPGPLRLFREPLATQSGWLLPLGLVGIVLVGAVSGRPGLQKDAYRALVLWAGWLLPAVIYFSATTGIFHSYYLAMLAPALAALVGGAFWAFERLMLRRAWPAWAVIVFLTGAALGFELFILWSYPAYLAWAVGVMLLLWLAGIGHLAFPARSPAAVGLGMILASLLVATLLWSGVTVFSGNNDGMLPHAGPQPGAVYRVNPLPGGPQNANPNGQGLPPGGQPPVMANPGGPNQGPANGGSNFNPALLGYLLDHTAPGSYLLATTRAQEAAPYVLATGRPVLALGGFSGGDNVVNLDRLMRMVSSGELRFVLVNTQLGQSKPQIGNWVVRNCHLVNLGANQPANQPIGQLYDCAPQGKAP